MHQLFFWNPVSGSKIRPQHTCVPFPKRYAQTKDFQHTFQQDLRKKIFPLVQMSTHIQWILFETFHFFHRNKIVMPVIYNSHNKKVSGDLFKTEDPLGDTSSLKTFTWVPGCYQPSYSITCRPTSRVQKLLKIHFSTVGPPMKLPGFEETPYF